MARDGRSTERVTGPAGPTDTPDPSASASGSAEASPNSDSAGAYVRIPGTRIKLIRPGGFTTTDRFSGFVQEDTSASIMITEMDLPSTVWTVGKSTPRRDILRAGAQVLVHQVILFDRDTYVMMQGRCGTGMRSKALRGNKLPNPCRTDCQSVQENTDGLAIRPERRSAIRPACRFDCLAALSTCWRSRRCQELQK